MRCYILRLSIVSVRLALNAGYAGLRRQRRCNFIDLTAPGA